MSPSQWGLPETQLHIVTPGSRLTEQPIWEVAGHYGRGKKGSTSLQASA